jgi:hypothetical protein
VIVKNNGYFQYTINDDLTQVHCYDLDKDPSVDGPFWYQHQHPSGKPWETVEEIEAWLTEMFIKPEVVVEETEVEQV